MDERKEDEEEEVGKDPSDEYEMPIYKQGQTMILYTTSAAGALKKESQCRCIDGNMPNYSCYIHPLFMHYSLNVQAHKYHSPPSG